MCVENNNHSSCRRRRATNEHFITGFTEENVVILPKSLEEFPGLDGITYLNLTLYITLPGGAKKSEYRTTDYVVPGTTLILLLRDEGPVIESQVRGRVAPSLTQKSSTDRDPSIDWMWAVIALSVVGTCVCFTALICFFVRKLKSTKKR